jgi:hypothetical protein
MKKSLAFLTSRKFTPWLLLILTIVSFGLLIPFMGYFMDDWYLIWFKHTFGALQYPAYFSLDRPLMGYFYIAANALLFNSESPLVWHIFGLLTRLVCTLALWQFLNTLWPKNNKQNTWVALLAAVFPGFLQHWIIVIYSFFYICLAGLFFSFTLMIKAMRNRKRFWVYYILSVLIGFYSYAAAEFYTGLELIRPVIIWLVLIEFFPLRRQRLWQTLKLWSPYLVIYLAFMVWRAFFFESMNHAVSITSQLLASPREVLIKTAGKLIQTIVDSTVSIWTQTLNLANYPGFGKNALSIILLMVIVFTSLVLWLKSFNRQGNDSNDSEIDSWSKQSFWLAAISLVVAIVPFWAADLEVSPRYPYDRFMLAYLLGSCLLFAGLINQFTRSRILPIVFLALFTAISVGFQLNQAQDYKKLSDYQRNFMWQLTWRAPDLEPGTALLSNGLPYQDYLSGNAITTQVQWTYSQKEVASTRALDYMFIFINSPQLAAIEEMSPNHAINYDFRTYQFHGSTNQVLLIGGNSSGCLRVLDKSLTPARAFADLYPKRMLDAASISTMDTILADANPKIPPQVLFGTEPAHTWCYFFEKAELARQKRDYAQAYNLIKDANGLGFFPKDLTEWYPYIDSALHLGHLEEAIELSNKIIQNDSVVRYGVCHTWENYSDSLATGDPKRENVKAQFSLMECP